MTKLANHPAFALTSVKELNKQLLENAKEEILATTKEVRGKVVSTASTSLSSVINGIVNLENFKVGDTVTKGQLLATQDSSNLEYNLQLKKNQLAPLFYD